MTSTYTYSVSDIEAAFRRFSADIYMIADSTQAITREKAAKYAHDAEYLARRGFLKRVDVTLLSDGVEVRATRYTVNESAGGLTNSRPGGVLWPRVIAPRIQVVLSYTNAYTTEKREKTRPYLEIDWKPSRADTSHAALSAAGGRDYVSNVYGLNREDFA